MPQGFRWCDISCHLETRRISLSFSFSVSLSGERPPRLPVGLASAQDGEKPGLAQAVLLTFVTAARLHKLSTTLKVFRSSRT